MSSLSVRLPDSLHKKVKELAKDDNISINQFIASALTEKVSAFNTELYLKERASRASKEKYKSALAKVKSSEADSFDHF